MKYLKKKKKSKVLPVLCLICVLLAVVAAVVFLLHRQGLLTLPLPTVPGATQGTTLAQTEPQIQSDDQTGLQTQPEGMVIETPYGDLRYPEELGSSLHVNVRREGVFTVEFFARLAGREDVPLFDICFGGGSDPIGAVAAEDGTLVNVSLRVYPFTPAEDWTQPEIDTVLAMQEAVNEVLGSLELQEAEAQPDGVRLETPYGILEIPGAWGDQLQAEASGVEPYTLEFYGCLPGREKVLLFSFRFGGAAEGAAAMTRDAAGDPVPVHLTVGELAETAGWSEQETDTLYAMQESLNELLESLRTD